MSTLRTLASAGLGVSALAAAFLTASPAAADTTSGGCATGALPTVVLGDPGVRPQQAQGVYLWHDAHGYALRVTHPGRARLVVSGVITVSRDVSHVQRVALEPADSVRVVDAGHGLAFRFTNYGGVDGFGFTAECSRTVHVALRVADRAATPAQVFLGRHRTSPTSVPFTVERAQGAQPARVR